MRPMLVAVPLVLAFAAATHSQEKPVLTIDKITIATKDTDKMIAFYTKTFGAEIKKGDPISGGKIGTLQIVLCPREVAGVKAEQNTIQLRFVVADIEKTVKAAFEAGGTKIDPITDSGTAKHASVRDPDGNSIELIQK